MKRLVIAGLLVAVVSTAAIAMLRRKVELPRYGAVPTFTLADGAGQPFGTQQLDGHVWVADFIFTTCPEICPRMTEEMSRLQTWLINRGLDGRLRLLSVSVDPERDTPEKLRTYAHQFHARPDTWTFVTGPQQVRDLVHCGAREQRQRFRVHLEEFPAARGERRDVVARQQPIRRVVGTERQHVLVGELDHAQTVPWGSTAT